MNQIPNIEETDNTRDVEDVVESLLKEAINDFDMAKASAGREVSFSYWFKEEITKALHHQLQKAKEEERERIAQMIRVYNPVLSGPYTDYQNYGMNALRKILLQALTQPNNHK